MQICTDQYDLSRSDEPVKPPKPKTQEVELGDSDWDETNFVRNIGYHLGRKYHKYICEVSPKVWSRKTRKIKNRNKICK